MQAEILGAGDVVILEPFVAGAIRARDHDPVQHGGEYRALDRKLELPTGQLLLEHRSDPAALPQSAEQQRRADPLAAQPVRIACRQLGQDRGTVGIARDRGGEAVETAIGQDGFLPAQVLDDALLAAPVLTDALDQIKVAVAVDSLLAHEHAELAAENQS